MWGGREWAEHIYIFCRLYSCWEGEMTFELFSSCCCDDDWGTSKVDGHLMLSKVSKKRERKMKMKLCNFQSLSEYNLLLFAFMGEFLVSQNGSRVVKLREKPEKLNFGRDSLVSGMTMSVACP